MSLRRRRSEFAVVERSVTTVSNESREYQTGEPRTSVAPPGLVGYFRKCPAFHRRPISGVLPGPERTCVKTLAEQFAQLRDAVAERQCKRKKKKSNTGQNPHCSKSVGGQKGESPSY